MTKSRTASSSRSASNAVTRAASSGWLRPPCTLSGSATFAATSPAGVGKLAIGTANVTGTIANDALTAVSGSGTGLQELYIQPAKLTADDWAVLAEGAKWSRAHADVLVDTHWLGGDPANLDVYGYASWSPRMGIIMLRNPDDQPHSFALDVGAAFELPAGSAGHFTLHSPWAGDAAQPGMSAVAGRPLMIELQPFEVRIFEAQP